MKHVFRFIGFAVVIIVVLALVLYTVNSFGYLKGPISHWINNIAGHCQGIVNDTTDFLEDGNLIQNSSQTEEQTPNPDQQISFLNP